MSHIMASLDGEAGIYVGEGKMSSLLVEALGLDLTEAVGVLLARSQKVGMQCAIIGAKANDGVLTFDPAYVSTSDSDLLAKGELDLKDEEARLELRTYPKDPSLGSLRTPVRIRGQLVDPRVSLDEKELAGRLAIGIALGLLSPAASLLATIEPGNAPERSCETYRQKLLTLRNAH
jgi:AsmA protein